MAACTTLCLHGLAQLFTAPCRHPDKNPDNEEEAKVKFQKIGAAYHRLTKDEDSDEEDEGFGASPFDEDDELAAMLFEFLCEPTLLKCFSSQPLPLLTLSSLQHCTCLLHIGPDGN